MTGAIHRQDNEHLNGYYRILRKREYEQLREVFPE